MILLIAAAVAAAAPAPAACPDVVTSEAFVCRALAASKSGQPEAAAQAFEQAAEAQNENEAEKARAWAAAGNMWIAAGEPGKAALSLDRALAGKGLEAEQRGEALLDRARAAGTPMRIGVNSGSLPMHLHALERENPVEALVIPQRAILSDQTGSYVLVVGEGKKAAAKHITTGANQGADVVVQQGLNDGDVVIVDGVQKVRPGQEVNPAPVAAEAAPGQPGAGQAPAKPAGN